MRSSVAGRSGGSGRVLRRVPGVPRPVCGTARREEEGVLHVARRVLGRHVQGFEVVVVVLDLRALEDLVAHPAEDRLDLVADVRERMEAAERSQAARAA